MVPYPPINRIVIVTQMDPIPRKQLAFGLFKQKMKETQYQKGQFRLAMKTCASRHPSNGWLCAGYTNKQTKNVYIKQTRKVMFKTNENIEP